MKVVGWTFEDFSLTTLIRFNASMITRILAMLCLGSGLLLCSCTKKTTTTNLDSASAVDTSRGNAPGDTSHPPPVAVVSDGNILAELDASDSSEIVQAKYVLFKTKNPDVRAFANLMLTDHTKIRKADLALSKKYKIIPATPKRDQDKADLTTLMPELESAGSDLDKVYANKAVENHVKELADLKSWEQTAQNPDLKKALVAAVPLVQSHLDRANALLKKLNGGK